MDSNQVHAALAQIDPHFGEVVMKSVGPLDWNNIFRTPYVALIGAIVGQRISYQHARSLRGMIFTALGTHFTLNEFVPWLKTSSIIPSDKRIIMERVNAYLVGKPADFLNTETNIRSLMEVPGIGEWTVKTVLLVTGLNLDVFPSEDYFIRKRMAKLMGGEMPTVAQVEAYAERWSPYRGLFAWYLWRWF